jgi:hypothetical protein
MRHSRTAFTKAQAKTNGADKTVLHLCHLLELSCVRYRKFKTLKAPEYVLKVETMLMQKYMAQLLRAEFRCVN